MPSMQKANQKRSYSDEFLLWDADLQLFAAKHPFSRLAHTDRRKALLGRSKVNEPKALLELTYPIARSRIRLDMTQAKARAMANSKNSEKMKAYNTK